MAVYVVGYVVGKRIARRTVAVRDLQVEPFIALILSVGRTLLVAREVAVRKLKVEKVCGRDIARNKIDDVKPLALREQVGDAVVLKDVTDMPRPPWVRLEGRYFCVK